MARDSVFADDDDDEVGEGLFRTVFVDCRMSGQFDYILTCINEYWARNKCLQNMVSTTVLGFRLPLRKCRQNKLQLTSLPGPALLGCILSFSYFRDGNRNPSTVPGDGNKRELEMD